MNSNLKSYEVAKQVIENVNDGNLQRLLDKLDDYDKQTLLDRFAAMYWGGAYKMDAIVINNVIELDSSTQQ